MSAEYLAKAHFSKKGYSILSPDSHDCQYDFIAIKDNLQTRVQVKSVIEYLDFNIARIRNKHGSNNKLYVVEDYDILAGVWVDRNRIYLFYSKDVNNNRKETITVSTLNGTELKLFDRPVPYYQGFV